MDIELKNKIESLRNDFSDGAVNYLKGISPSIGAPEIYTGCFCKEGSRIEFNRRFFTWYDNINKELQ